MQNIIKFHKENQGGKKLIFINIYDVIKMNLIKFAALSLLFTNILSAGQPNYSWTEITITPPADIPQIRYRASMAFDPTTGRMILFGGYNSVDDVYLNDTWAFDGTSWVQLFPSAVPPDIPSARFGASMAFDPVTEQMILFGGLNEGDFYNDTWVLSETGWTDITPVLPDISPPSRYTASMAFDTTVGKMILFGGWGESSSLYDTWAFDGTSWEQLFPSAVPPAVPAARYGASMEFDPNLGHLLLFGGRDGGSNFNDTWVFDGISGWSKLTLASSPPECSYSSMGYDPVTGQMILFGGFSDSGDLNDTWIFDGTGWSLLSLTSSPPVRASASMGFDTVIEQMILFGGQTATSNLNDTWALFSTQPAPPNNLSGFQKKNDFGTFYELFSTLKWKASSSAISGYYVYRNGVLIATLGATTFEYSDHNNAKDEKITYSVTAFDSSGGQSSPVYITIP